MFIEKKANAGSIKRRKLIEGVGINDAPYAVNQITAIGRDKTTNRLIYKRTMCPYYLVWSHMLKRCYSEIFYKKNPTYINCMVCDEWLTFSIFKSWMEKQDWKNKEIDKDILIPHNKIYSASTCIFIPKKINQLLNKMNSTRGKYSTGVSLNKNKSKFQARCSNGNKEIHLGYFTLESEAAKCYLDYKSDLITKIAYNQSDIKLKKALLELSSLIKLGEYY